MRTAPPRLGARRLAPVPRDDIESKVARRTSGARSFRAPSENRVRVLITGVGGFAGGHLADHLAAATDWRLWGTVHPRGIDQATPRPDVTALPVDLLDADAVRATLDAAEPDLVFHLAGQTFVPAAWRDPWATFEANVRMQLNLLTAMIDAGRPMRLVAVTSNEVYGAGPADRQRRCDEQAPLAPLNPYAVSKAAQDLLAAQYGLSHDVDVVRVRPFTHVGPRQSDRFVSASFARQVAEVEAGLRAEIRVGNLDAARDFTDVRDIVRGYRLAAERGERGAVYNLGSGVQRAIGDLLDALRADAHVSVPVKVDPDLLRPADSGRAVCDAALAERALDWRPEIGWNDTLHDILDDWRARVAASIGA